MRFLMILLIAFAVATQCRNSEPELSLFERQREMMVKRQIEKRGIRDPRVLTAMKTVERHRFVLPAWQEYAYDDRPLPIDEGQTISQPYIVAFMTEALQPTDSMRVLEVGTGSGYQAAILAELCREVYTIEIFESLGEKAAALMRQLGYTNVQVRIGDGYLGWPEAAPFDAIIVTCAPTHIPEPLKEQLAEGGKMIIPVGGTGRQELVVLTKIDGVLTEKTVLPVRFVPMLQEDGGKY